MDELRDWIALHRICWIRPQPAWELALRASGVSNLLHLARHAMCPISDQDWSIIEQIRAAVDWRQADRDLDLIEKKRIRVILRADAAYPALLNEINDPPLLLFWRGKLAQDNCIAIVGSRKATAYGRDVIDLIVKL